MGRVLLCKRKDLSSNPQDLCEVGHDGSSAVPVFLWQDGRWRWENLETNPDN